MGEEFKDFRWKHRYDSGTGSYGRKRRNCGKRTGAARRTCSEEPVSSPQEQKMVDDFAAKIDVENLTQVMQYGAGTQKKMADFSDEALKM